MPDKAPTPEPSTIRGILSQLGVTFQRIKFGGVVGKQTLLAIVGVVGLAAIAWRADQGHVWILGIGAIVLVVAVAIMNYVYADKHPAEATLEGAEIIAFHKLELGSDTKVYSEEEFMKLQGIKNPTQLTLPGEPPE